MSRHDRKILFSQRSDVSLDSLFLVNDVSLNNSTLNSIEMKKGVRQGRRKKYFERQTKKRIQDSNCCADLIKLDEESKKNEEVK